MYNDSFFYNVNIIAKFIFYIFIVLSMIFVNNIYILLLFLIFNIYCFKSIKYVFIGIMLFILMLIYNPLLILFKLILIFSSFIIFIRYLNIDSIRFIVEKIFYKYKNSSISYLFLYLCYFIKYFKINYYKYKDLYRGFGINNSFTSIVKLTYCKTKDDINLLVSMYNIRFYNYYSRRTYYNDYSINSFDVKVVLLSVILFFFVYVFWR